MTTQKATSKFRIIIFVVVPTLGILGGIIAAQVARCFPHVDILSLLITVFLVGFVVFFAIGIVGIYSLERRYGNTFYITKWK